MFINRKKELEYLEKTWSTDKAELIVVWGRRRVGKTRLLHEFIKGKKAIYLYVFHATERALLESFTREIKKQIGIDFPPGYIIPNWESFLELLGSISRDERVAVVIDEFQRLVEVSQSSIDLLQYWWDNKLSTTKVKFYLVGSSIGMVEKVALSGSGPLYGRKTGVLHVRPMNFFEIWSLLRKVGIEKAIEYYAVFGGTPHYITTIDLNKSLEVNIIEKILSPHAPLRDEPEQLLRTELRTLKVYMEILEKLATSKGSIGIGDLSSYINKSRSELYPYITQLEKMDLVTREWRVPGGKKEYRRARFKISDNFIRFWFRYVYPYYPDLEMGNHEEALRDYQNTKNEFIANTYEEILKEYIRKNSGRKIIDALGKKIILPKFTKIGRWWTKNEEIDICAISKKHVLLGEVKWREKIDKKTVIKLIGKKTQTFKETTKIDKDIIYLIGVKTLTEEAKELLKELEIITVTLNEIEKTSL